MRLLIGLFFACMLWSSAQAQTPATPATIEQIRQNIGVQLAQRPNNRVLRFRYAQASFQSGRIAEAKYHLNLLMRTSHSEGELKQLQNAYATVVRASPWSFGLNFSLIPSTNINKTSSNRIFETPLGQFVIEDGGVEESGIGLRYGGRLSLEIPLASGATLTHSLDLNRSQFKAERLNSLNGTYRVTWAKRSLGGYTQIAPYIKRTLYSSADGSCYNPSETEAICSNSTRKGIRLSHEYYLTDTRSVTGDLTAERREYDYLDHLNGGYTSASLSYRDRVFDIFNLKLRFGLTKSTPQLDHLRYNGASVSVEVARPLKSIGTIGVILGLDTRQYEGDFPTLDEPREDRSNRIGMSFRTPHIRIFEHSPKLSCSFNKNRSNVALYEYQSTDCALTFDYSF